MRTKKYPPFFLPGFILLIAFVARARLASMPLERDEGEYAYMAQLILQGIPPYSEAYAMKFPGIYAAYAAILAFLGQTDIAIRLGLLLLNLATILVVFLIAQKSAFSISQKTQKKEFDIGGTSSLIQPGVWAAAAYAVFSLSPSMLGITANAEHFILFPVLLGVWLILTCVPTPSLRQGIPFEVYSFKLAATAKLFFAGICFGLAGCIKQQGLIFMLMGFILIGLNLARPKEKYSLPLFFKASVFYIIGGMIPFSLFGIWLWKAGVFSQFQFWCFDYAQHYGSMWSFRDGLAHFTTVFLPIVKDHAPLFIIGLFGFVVSWIYHRKVFWFLITNLFIGFSATMPGLIFRPHYFLLITPSLALSTGIGLATLLEIARQNDVRQEEFYSSGKGHFHTFLQLSRLWAFLGFFILVFPILIQSQILFSKNPEDASRQLYPHNAFPEIRTVAYELSKRTKKTDRIGVMGSEPQIYFYSQRRAATPYLYLYPLFEPQPYAAGMQKNAMAVLENNPPSYLVHVRIPTSWLIYPNSDIEMLKWLPIFLNNHYEKEFSISIPHPKGTHEIVVYRKNQSAIVQK